MIREEDVPDYDDRDIYYASYIQLRPEDQEQEHKKKNYDFTRVILKLVQELREKEKNVDRLDNLKEDADDLAHLLDPLKEDTRSYIDFFKKLDKEFESQLEWVYDGKVIQTWCSAGTCSHGSGTYRFVDEDHLSWLEEIIERFEKLKATIIMILGDPKEFE